MLQISTQGKRKTKKVEIDGFGFNVRQPGAGESLDLSKFGEEVEKFKGADGTISAEAEEKVGEKTVAIMTMLLSFFESEDEKAIAHLKSLDPELLMNVIAQIFQDK